MIRNNYQPSFARLEDYLKTIGRRKLIAPLYTELMKTPRARHSRSASTRKARPGYHPDTAAAIDAIVNSSAPDEAE